MELHRIRPSRTSANLSGHPNELYFLSQILSIQICKSCDQLIVYANKHFTCIGARDFLCQLDATDLQDAYKYAKEPDPPWSLE